MRMLALVAALVLLVPPAQAERWRVGEDEEGIEAGDCEAEFAFERSRSRGEPRQREAALQLSCGIGWNSELALTAARQRADDERSRTLELELQAMLRPHRGREPGWTLVATLAAERALGASWRRSEQALGLEATLEPWADWLLEARLGWARERDRHADRTTWLLGIEHALASRLDARAELEGDDRKPAMAAMELRWAVWPELAHLTFGGGRRLGGDRERKLSVALGIEF